MYLIFFSMLPNFFSHPSFQTLRSNQTPPDLSVPLHSLDFPSKSFATFLFFFFMRVNSSYCFGQLSLPIRHIRPYHLNLFCISCVTYTGKYIHSISHFFIFNPILQCKPTAPFPVPHLS